MSPDLELVRSERYVRSVDAGRYVDVDGCALRVPCLFMAIGPVASGKSTLCRRVVAALRAAGAEAVVVSRDLVRAEVMGAVNDLSTEEAVSTVQYAQASAHLDAGRTVLVDDTNLVAAHRHRLYDALGLRARGVPVVVALRAKDLTAADLAAREAARRRATGRPRVPDDVIARMHARWLALGAGALMALDAPEALYLFSDRGLYDATSQRATSQGGGAIVTFAER